MQDIVHKAMTWEYTLANVEERFLKAYLSVLILKAVGQVNKECQLPGGRPPEGMSHNCCYIRSLLWLRFQHGLHQIQGLWLLSKQLQIGLTLQESSLHTALILFGWFVTLERQKSPLS